jgi:pSer/pThr/pTyr-binding forkhead associated (FHA) protein
MIRCSTCMYDNPDGTISCSTCGLNLDKQGMFSTRQNLKLPAQNDKGFHSAHVGQLPDRGIAVYVGTSAEPIIVSGHDKYTLGRRKDVPIPDLVDLTPYDAYRMGVSRNHAVLTYKDKNLYIHDVGSVNGTWLNGQRLKAYELYSIQPGAVVSLGQLALYVYF